MNALVVLSLIGSVFLGVLTALFAVVGHSTRERWAWFMALGGACCTIVFTVLAVSRPVLDMAAAPSMLMTALLGLSYWLITAGLMSYLRYAWRPMAWVLGALLVLLLSVRVGIATGWVQRSHGASLGALVSLVWIALCLVAARKGPRADHGIVVLALMSFPLTWWMVQRAAPDAATAVAWHILPMAVVSATLLTTGLLRAWAQAHRELVLRTEAEQQLRATNDTLELRVQRRTAQLSETIEGLESFNRSISHDLRGPLGGMAQLAQMAAARLRANDPASAAPLLDAIAAQAGMSAELVAALLALARVSNAPVNIQHVDTARVVKEALQSLRPPGAPAPPVRTEALPVVDADPQLLRQVFVNLLGNAIKFTAKCDAPSIEVGTMPTSSGPIFFVKDNGVGFDGAQAGLMFEPFRRLHGKAYAGTGIGLSIVKRIVDSHGGRIWAESEPGQGAAFYFTVHSTAGNIGLRASSAGDLPASVPNVHPALPSK